MDIRTQKNIRRIALVTGLAALTLTYQNCGKINIVDIGAQELATEVERARIGKDDEIATVGLNQVPKLKMFFIVDNSGTMKQNQLNLSDSFASMFDAQSAGSLSKFETTAVLLSTAQKSPSYITEKSTLDSLVNLQKNYLSGMSVPLATFQNSMRSSDLNSGWIPGDNTGYSLKATTNPISYTFLPAPVLGVQQNSGQITFQDSIRKAASEDSRVLESEFKNRLAILNADRIPLLYGNGSYKPQYSDIVDSESGLCAIARILRNPKQNILSGDLLSFTVVSDENDNDPLGINCVQSVTQFDGTEDLVDGACTLRESKISYQTTTSNSKNDYCKLSGNVGYNYKLAYKVGTTNTTMTYKTILQAAQYKAKYTNLTYKATSTSYQYLKTNISYYRESCSDIISDGIVTGKKCVTSPSPVSASASGNHSGNCYGLAKQLDANAVNSAGKSPTCSTAYVNIGSCAVSDPLCKATSVVNNKTVSKILGSLDPAVCLNKAKSYPDYASGTTPVCVDASKLVSSCSSSEQSAGCVLVSPTTYSSKTISLTGDYTTGSKCLDHAKKLGGNAVQTVADITKCEKVNGQTNQTYSSTLSFAQTKAYDAGSTIAANADCGALKAIALSTAMAANSQIPSTSSCVITGYKKASDTGVPLVSGCPSQANDRCASDSLRSCSGVLVSGTPTPVESAEIEFASIQEHLNCSSKCSDSKLGVCAPGVAPSTTVAQYLKTLYGVTATCKAVTKDVVASKEPKVAQLASAVNEICAPNSNGLPRYFSVSKGPYRTRSVEVDYVAGTMKDKNGNSIPAQNLVDYIQTQAKNLSNGDAIFSAIVRLPSDPLGQGGTHGTAYKALVDRTGGQMGSVLTNDYSFILKDLSQVIKSNIERTLILQKMQATQVIKAVFKVGIQSQLEPIDASQWTQNGQNLVFKKSFELNEGDQFKIEFQNF